MKNKAVPVLSRIIYIILGFLSSSSLLIFSEFDRQIPVLACAIGFAIINLPVLFQKSKGSIRLRICYHGATCLLTFAFSCLLSVLFHLVMMFFYIPDNWEYFAFSAIICTIQLSVTFWNGIISVYLTSVQLGIRHRVVGLLCGLIPIANLFALTTIIKTAFAEVSFEAEKIALNKERENKQICKTKYPVLFVHGIFFRDFKHLNYWGRIPEELVRNGATVYYGNHQSALTIKNSGIELSKRIKEIVKETGCNKVNIIAHSKGGLDCRYALEYCDVKNNVASLTTINTPHKGCEFADYLLSKVPQKIQNTIADTYNATMKKIGDDNPDFISAVKDLSAENTGILNNSLKEDNLQSIVFCQSFGSKLNKAAGGKFPLNFSYHLVKYFDGANDGLVSEKSFPWGERYKMLTTRGKRGISHGDMIDLNRENIKEFDVREFYVSIVADLKNRGL